LNHPLPISLTVDKYGTVTARLTITPEQARVSFLAMKDRRYFDRDEGPQGFWITDMSNGVSCFDGEAYLEVVADLEPEGDDRLDGTARVTEIPSGQIIDLAARFRFLLGA
jgi:hypothetical protein